VIIMFEHGVPIPITAFNNTSFLRKMSVLRPSCGLVHNHPSGDPTPSTADIAVTNEIIKTAAPLGITVHDHLIIGRGRHTSLRDLGVIPSEAGNRARDLGASVSPQYSVLHDKDPID